MLYCTMNSRVLQLVYVFPCIITVATALAGQKRYTAESRLKIEVKQLHQMMEEQHSNQNPGDYEQAVHLALEKNKQKEWSKWVVSALNEAGRPALCDFDRVTSVLLKVKPGKVYEEQVYGLFHKLMEQHVEQGPCCKHYIRQPELDGRTLTATLQMPEDDGWYAGVSVVVRIEVAENHPARPPTVTLKTKEVGDTENMFTSLFHPNVDGPSGQLEMSLWREGVWSIWFSVNHILCNIVRLLKNPLAETDFVRNTTAANLIKNTIAKAEFQEAARKHRQHMHNLYEKFGELGFERDDALAVLKRCNGDVEKAVDDLFKQRDQKQIDEKRLQMNKTELQIVKKTIQIVKKTTDTQTIDRWIDMGFTEEQCLMSLRAADDNVSKAEELLVEGKVDWIFKFTQMGFHPVRCIAALKRADWCDTTASEILLGR